MKLTNNKHQMMGLVSDELERILKEAVMAQCGVLWQDLPEGPQDNCWKAVSTRGLRAEA
jgi:hypothetical protein